MCSPRDRVYAHAHKSLIPKLLPGRATFSMPERRLPEKALTPHAHLGFRSIIAYMPLLNTRMASASEHPTIAGLF